MRLGTALIQTRAYGQAEISLRRALELDPKCIEAWVNLGGILLGRFDFEGCVEVNRKALECDPDAMQAHYNQGLGHLYLNQAKEMVECFRKVLAKDPENAGAHYHLAVGLNALGQEEEAQAAFHRSLNLGHAPQPEFVRLMGKKNNSSLTTIEMGPESEN